MNNVTLNLHLEILDKKRLELLDKLTLFLKGYVLGGGTALSLRLAHRKSFDFDFFSPSPVSNKLLEKISTILKIDSIAIDNQDELTFFTSSIKVTFLAYPFKPHFQPETTAQGWFIHRAEEIALQKAYTIGRRGEYRDYFDLFTILKNNILLFDNLIALTKEVYKGAFDEKLFLEQLVYFKDLLNFDLVPVSSQPLPLPSEVKTFFENTVKTFLTKN